MDNFIIIIIFINIAIFTVGAISMYNTAHENTLEEDKLALERERLQFEKYKFDETEHNKYTYLLHKLKQDREIKVLEVENLNKMNIRDNETHRLEIEALVKERREALDVEKEKANGMVEASLKKAQLTTGLNFKEDVLDTFDNIIRIEVETYMYKHILNENDTDTIKPEDISIPVGLEYNKQLNELKTKIIDNIGLEATSIFDRYMKREMWNTMLYDMLSVYWSKSIKIAKSRKLQLAKNESSVMVHNDRKPALFINNTVNQASGLTDEQIYLIRDLKIKNMAELSKVIEQIKNDNGNLFGVTYKPLTDIKLTNFR